MQTPTRTLSVGSPMVNRSCGVLFALGMGLSTETAAGQDVLTEVEVIALARATSPAVQVARATEALSRAQASAAGLMPNPTVSWERETLLTGSNNAQDILRASFPIDIARPLTVRSLAASESAWTRAEAELDRTRAISEVVLAYYDVVVLEHRLEVLSHALQSLEEASRVLARRESAGTASGYESTRLGIATELARSERALIDGTLRGARARLGTMLGIDPAGLRVDTTLTLAALPNEAVLVERATRNQDVVSHARASVSAAEDAANRAGWTWLPTLSLNGGVNLVDDVGTRYGYVAGVSLAVPIFDGGAGLRAQADAQEALSRAREAALAQELRGQVASAYAVYDAARIELERFDTATAVGVETLVAAAQSGYREGQRTIVELLDAQATATEVAERCLELFAAAKRAEVLARAAAGELQ